MTLTGDPSFFAFNGDEAEAEEEDPEAPPVERFRELHRLSHVVRVRSTVPVILFKYHPKINIWSLLNNSSQQKIDHDCALVPRGALAVDAAKRVIPSTNFQGLSYQSASEARAYQHLRQPESLQGIALLKKPGIVKSGDFLDCIDQDKPNGEYCSLVLTNSNPFDLLLI
jgi:hypothetical protein